MDHQEIFNQVYRSNRWIFGSGTGAVTANNRPYLRFLQDLLDGHPEIRSVLDVGCGDWQIGSQIRWGERDYLGLDCSDYILDATRARHGGGRIRFAVGNAVLDPLPPADLLILKDVLEHLSHADIATLLEKARSYPFVLIQNDIGLLVTANHDIATGGYRAVDVRQPPFAFAASRTATYLERHLLALLWTLGLGGGYALLATGGAPPALAAFGAAVAACLALVPRKGICLRTPPTSGTPPNRDAPATDTATPPGTPPTRGSQQ